VEEVLVIEIARVVIDPDLDDGLHCAMCNRRNNIFVLEKHHIWPVGWGGPSTTAATAQGKIWVFSDGNCHNTLHVILDHMKKVGEWDETYVKHWEFPYGPTRYAKLGWERYLAHLEGKELERISG
jgi:hypothetical protein